MCQHLQHEKLWFCSSNQAQYECKTYEVESKVLFFAPYVCFKCEMCHKLFQWLCLPAHLWLIFGKENKVMYLHVKGHFWRAVIIFSVQCYLLIHNLFSARKTWPGHKYAAKCPIKFAVNWNSHLHKQNQTHICIHELMNEITASICALYSDRVWLLISKWCK